MSYKNHTIVNSMDYASHNTSLIKAFRSSIKFTSAKKYISSTLLCCTLATVTQQSLAQNVSIEADLGHAVVGNDRYNSGYSQEISGAYHWDSIIIRVGGLVIKDIDLKNADDSYIDIEGQYIAISKEFDHRNLSLEIGAGYLDTSIEAYYLDYPVIKEDDGSAFLNAKAAMQLSRIFSLVLDWKYIDDISGEDFNAVQLGARFSF